MSNEIFEYFMRCSKEAIARAYMCRDYYENKCFCPADEEGFVCPWGSDREMVLHNNSARLGGSIEQ